MPERRLDARTPYRGWQNFDVRSEVSSTLRGAEDFADGDPTTVDRLGREVTQRIAASLSQPILQPAPTTSRTAPIWHRQRSTAAMRRPRSRSPVLEGEAADSVAVEGHAAGGERRGGGVVDCEASGVSAWDGNCSADAAS